MIPDRLRILWQRTPRGCIFATVIILIFSTVMLGVGRYTEAKYAATLTIVVLYLLHLLIGAGAAFTIMRLWYHRDNPLIKRMALYMHSAPIAALTAIVLLFMAKGVTFTWKFTITLFAGTLLADIVRIPFILYMTRGDSPHASTVPKRITKPAAGPDMNAPS